MCRWMLSHAKLDVDPKRSRHMNSSVRRHQIRGRVDHRLKPPLDAAPIRFHVVGAHAGDWVLEVAAVIDRLVSVLELRQRAVGRPLVGPDCCARHHNPLDNRDQRRRLPILDELDVPFFLLWIEHTKHPTLPRTELMSSVIFCPHHHRFVDLDDLSWTS